MAVIEGLKAMRIGVDSVYWAKLLTDDGTTITWGTPVSLPGVMVMNVNPNVSIETAFYDDGPGEVATTLGNVEVSFDKSALGPQEKATLLGQTLDSNGILWQGSNDTPPWGAIGFRCLKSDGTYRYVWLYKGKFTIPPEDAETKADSINFQNDQITGRFVKTNKSYTVTNSVTATSKQVYPWKVEVDGSDVTSTDLSTAWFAQVVQPNTPL